MHLSILSWEIPFLKYDLCSNILFDLIKYIYQESDGITSLFQISLKINELISFNVQTGFDICYFESK